MALALYRKYRPRTFAEVIGQEHVTEPLIAALRGGRLNHAYLFSGPRGCGKTSSARILARSLNCERGPTPEPCGECDSCVALAPDGPGSIDVIEIDAASHGGVDDARELRERAIFAPVSSRFKVYIIDEAHMVSSAGFNALLKLVEEPPDYVKFVFATTEPEKVLGTIKSRTHHYPFRLIAPGVLRPYLEKLCESEGVKVEPAVFPLVVRAGGGSVRDSLSVLDQLIAGAGPDGVSYAGAVALLGVTDVALIDEMCDALAAGDGAAAYATIDRVADAGHDPRRFASDLLERLRDLIVMQQVPDAVAKGLIDAPDDDLARMVGQAERFGQATLSRLADIVHNGLAEMRGTTAPRLLLELICARMLLPGADDSTAALLQRLERMERRLTATGDASVYVVPAAPSAAMPAPSAMPAPVAAMPEPSAEPVPAAGPAAGVRSAEQPGGARAAATPTGMPEPPARPAPTQKAAPAEGQGPAEGAAPAPGAAPAQGERPSPGMTPAAARPGGSAPPSTPPPAVGAIDAAAVRRVWDEVLLYVGRKSKKVAAWAREATVREVEGTTLVLAFKHNFHASALSNDPAHVVEAVREILGGTWQVRCEVAGAAPRSAPAARPAPVPPAASAPRQPPGRPAGNAAANPQPNGRAGGGQPGGGQPGGGQPGGGQPGGALPPDNPEDDWPATARPGGQSAAAPDPPDRGRGQAGSGPAAAPAPPVAAGNAPVATAGATPGTGPADARAAARAAASGRGANGRSGGIGGGRPQPGQDARAGADRPGSEPPAAGRSSPADAGWDAPPEEPPYDPDYDPPVRDARTHDGFDPGDEPLDEVLDEQTVRQTSEEQALQLLRQALGAEMIGEVDVR